MSLTFPFVVCPRCNRVSYHPKDIEHAYCGFCRQFHGEMVEIAAGASTGRVQFAQPPERVEEVRAFFGRILDGSLMLPMPANELAADPGFICAYNVLCWILGSPDGTFEERLAELDVYYAAKNRTSEGA